VLNHNAAKMHHGFLRRTNCRRNQRGTRGGSHRDPSGAGCRNPRGPTWICACHLGARVCCRTHHARRFRRPRPVPNRQVSEGRDSRIFAACTTCALGLRGSQVANARSRFSRRRLSPSLALERSSRAGAARGAFQDDRLRRGARKLEGGATLWLGSRDRKRGCRWRS
jgi:hypothetical protein